MTELRAMEGDPLPVVSKEEVLGAIARRRNGKAPGADGIANTDLKKLPCNAIDILVQILNAMLSQRVFPNVWKHASVLMLPHLPALGR